MKVAMASSNHMSLPHSILGEMVGKIYAPSERVLWD